MMPFHTIKSDELLGQLNDTEKKNAPKELYYAGNPEHASFSPKVAVVGTRSLSPGGRNAALEVTEGLCRNGATIISGLARGVDTIAHRTAMRLGGHTVAVLGTPLDRFYPAENRDLQLQMAEEQLVVSQFPIGASVGRMNFPIRNRTMALIADATIIIEAGPKSGTEHQGWEALRLGRLLLVMEELAMNKELRWVQELIKYGAQPFSMGMMDVLFENLPSGPREPVSTLAR